MRLIGLVGNRKSGKDTLVRLFSENNSDCRVESIAFADYLKELCSELFDIPLKDFYDQSKKEKKFKSFYLFSNPKIFSSRIVYQLICILSEQKCEMSFENMLKLDCLENKKLYSIREILQFIGTDVLRNCIDDNFHINRVKNIIKNYQKHNLLDYLFITDIRYQNEANIILDNEGALLKINREGTDQGSHTSDTELNKIKVDIEINNNGTLDDFSQEINKIIIGGI